MLHARSLTIAFCVVFLGLAFTATARNMLQEDPASWADPSGTPQECTGSFFAGNQWAGDEIECHVCPNNEYQLKCDLDTDIVGDDSAKCEFGRAGLAGAVDNAREFDCVLDNSQDPPLQCDWVKLQNDLPGCAWEPVSRILATWKPVE
ncbi:hypothetical protein D9Q98_007724 [Chlorella vulgaris]|uniref:Uncharacterized protein n=1 Tax=Chlorella vulgaris TaxID=3077 RepID=A0A9D4THD6_CHLVU|nr:hypothetical protein D9Q98_007724 [Chlorella vulgaris]